MERVDKTQQFGDKGKISDSSKTPADSKSVTQKMINIIARIAGSTNGPLVDRHKTGSLAIDLACLLVFGINSES